MDVGLTRRVRVGVSVVVPSILIRPYKKSKSLIYKVRDIWRTPKE